MQRRIYTAFLKSGKEQEAVCKLMLQVPFWNGQVENPSLFRFGNQIFLYFEFAGKEIHPEDIFIEAADYLEAKPGSEGFQHWIRMYDIFHYQAPQTAEEWRRKAKVERPVGRVVRLKPEMIASYIFYHYQYQEEKPGDGYKYGIIAIHEDLLFFYYEYPAYREPPSYDGKLNTKNTPANWRELMSRHFMEWPDSKSADDNWRDAAVLFTSFQAK